MLIARSSLKKATRCSGNSAKSWLIICSVHSKTAARMSPTRSVMSGCARRQNEFAMTQKAGECTPSRETMVVMTFSTSASLAAGVLRL